MTTMYIVRDLPRNTYKWVTTQGSWVTFKRSADILRDVRKMQGICPTGRPLVVVTDCDVLHTALQFNKGCKLLRPNNGCKQDWFKARMAHTQEVQSAYDATLYFNRRYKSW